MTKLCVNGYECKNTHDFVYALEEHKIEFAHYENIFMCGDTDESFFIRKNNGKFFYISIINRSIYDFKDNISISNARVKEMFNENDTGCLSGIYPKKIKVTTSNDGDTKINIITK